MIDAELDSLIEGRLAELDAMLDPNNQHPLVGAGQWVLSDDELTSTLDDASVTHEMDIGGPVAIVAGYLSADHGVDATGTPHPFCCVRVKGDGAGRRHLFFAPTKD